MVALVTRAGKGSTLTNLEVDTNFTNLNTGKVERVTYSVMDGYTTDQGLIAVPNQGLMQFDGVSRYITVDPGHGQCQFRFVSSTLCKLFPYDGNGLIINGRQYRIPVAGISLTPAQTTASATHYIFAKDDGSGGVALEAAASGVTHAMHTDGVEIKTGDPTRTLVGMVSMSGTNTFLMSGIQRRVASWFNRRPIILAEYFITSTSSSSPATISTGWSFLAWQNAMYRETAAGQTRNTATTVGNYSNIYLDGTPIAQAIGYTITTANYQQAAAQTAGTTISADGLHTSLMIGYCNGGTATFEYNRDGAIEI
jgi:hypothetical protein